jgi:hypothetical protein
MDENRDPPPDLRYLQDPRHTPTPPRRFVYRSAEPDTHLAHPLRRATDFPRPFQAIPGQLCPNPVLLKFRVYLKLN